MTFKIMGQNRSGVIEEIDETDTRDDADYLAQEYSMAFGMSWIIWVKED